MLSGEPIGGLPLIRGSHVFGAEDSRGWLCVELPPWRHGPQELLHVLTVVRTKRGVSAKKLVRAWNAIDGPGVVLGIRNNVKNTQVSNWKGNVRSWLCSEA
jgi:hypothetical protein